MRAIACVLVTSRIMRSSAHVVEMSRSTHHKVTRERTKFKAQMKTYTIVYSVRIASGIGRDRRLPHGSNKNDRGLRLQLSLY